MSNRSKIVISGILSFVPMLALADATALNTTAVSFQTLIGGTLPKLFFALALVYFFWGLGSYALSAADEKKRTEAKQTMIWGIIILVVMASVWGLIALVQGALDISAGTAPVVPAVN